MNLIDIVSGFKLTGIIEKVENIDFENIQKSKNFDFDWNMEKENQTFKIKLIENEEILGLISISDYPHELRTHINLIESSKKHRGRNKKIHNIAGCLIAFACKIAFKNGYEGFVSLTPKTQLIEYYKKTYGFQKIGNQMAVFDAISETIIIKYLENEEI